MPKQFIKKTFYLREVILGGQDGLVNVLGVVLAVAIATGNHRVVIIAGLAATFAESLSMGAVAFTSSHAARDEFKEINRQDLLEAEGNPVTNSIWVLVSALIGSVIPLIPFFLFDVSAAIWVSFTASAVALFIMGVYKAKMTLGNPVKEGAELAGIGLFAAVAGYAIGALLGVVV